MLAGIPGGWAVSDHADSHGNAIPVAADITCSLPGRTACAVWRHPPRMPEQAGHQADPDACISPIRATVT